MGADLPLGMTSPLCMPREADSPAWLSRPRGSRVDRGHFCSLSWSSGGDGSVVRIQRYVAAGDQQRDDHRHLPDGPSDSGDAEQRQTRPLFEAGRAHSDLATSSSVHLVENWRQGSIPIGRSWKLEWQAAHFCSQHRSRICWYFRWHRQSVEDREALNEARAPALLFDPSAFSVCHCSWEA